MSNLRQWGPTIAAGALGAALLIIALASCGPGGRARDLRGRVRIHKPSALHALHNKRMQDVLANFESGPQPDPQELATARERCADQLAEAASSLAASTEDIARGMGDIELDENNRELFHNLNNNMRQQAGTIGRQAKQQAFKQVRSSLDEMQSTCKACHGIFRSKQPGV